MDLSRAIQEARPGEQFALYGEDISGLVWLDETEKPTLQEITDVWNNSKPMREWIYEIESHSMSRREEEIIGTMTATSFAKLPQYTKDLYTEKVALRATKPQ